MALKPVSIPSCVFLTEERGIGMGFREGFGFVHGSVWEI